MGLDLSIKTVFKKTKDKWRHACTEFKIGFGVTLPGVTLVVWIAWFPHSFFQLVYALYEHVAANRLYLILLGIVTLSLALSTKVQVQKFIKAFLGILSVLAMAFAAILPILPIEQISSIVRCGNYLNEEQYP